MNNPPLQAALSPSKPATPRPSAPPPHTPLKHDGRQATHADAAAPAVLAWSEGEPVVPQLLIDHGADMDSTAGGALAPLEMAAASLHPGIAELLIAHGALHLEVPPLEVARKDW